MISPFPEIDIDNSIVNDIVDVVENSYKTAVDNSGRIVFTDVARGLVIPKVTVPEGSGPFIRLWENRGRAQVRSVQMVDSLWYPVLSIFVGFCALPDINGQYADAQQFRNNLAKFAIRCLNLPSVSGNGITPGNNWNFDNPQDITVDFTAPMQGLGFDVPIMPPWYVTRLDVGIEAFNLDPST